MPTYLSFTIYGNLASKSNSRRLTMRGSKPMMIKSQRAMDWLTVASLQVPARYRAGWTTPLKMTAHVYYDSMRPDLDVSLLMDFLQECGVYKNDRLIQEQHLYRHLDKKNPRVEIELELLA